MAVPSGAVGMSQWQLSRFQIINERKHLNIKITLNLRFE
jgi:hypothetical protein